MVSCHHEEALNYKFKHNIGNKSLNDLDRVAQWLKQYGSIWVPIAIKSLLWGPNPQKVQMFSLTIEDDNESTNRAYIASTKSQSILEGNCLKNPKKLSTVSLEYFRFEECGSRIVISYISPKTSSE